MLGHSPLSQFPLSTIPASGAPPATPAQPYIGPSVAIRRGWAAAVFVTSLAFVPVIAAASSAESPSVQGGSPPPAICSLQYQSITGPVLVPAAAPAVLTDWLIHTSVPIRQLARPSGGAVAPVFVPDTTQPVTAHSWAPRYPDRVSRGSGVPTRGGTTAAFFHGGRTYYVHATAGSDANDGLTPGSAWQSLAKVSGAAFYPGDTVLFSRGEFWIGELRASSSGGDGAVITYGAYGSGANPLISSSAPVTSWTKTGGLTNVYQSSISGGDIDTVWASGWFSVWYSTSRWMATAASAAACDATPGSCFYDTAADLLYVHTIGSTNPATDGDSYWATFYQIAVSTHGKNYLEFQDLDALYASAHGFFTANVSDGLPWTVSDHATLTRCSSIGSVHNSFSLIGTTIAAVDCVALYATNDGAFVLADARVADAGNPPSDGLSAIRCTFSTNTIYGGRAALAFKAEGTPSNVTVTDCIVTGDCTGAWYSYTGATVSGLTIDGLAITGAVGIAISDHNSTGVTIEGVVMSSRSTSYGILLDTPGSLAVRNNTILSALCALAIDNTASADISRNILDGGAVYGVLLTGSGTHAIVNNVIISSGGYGVIWTDASLITSDVIKNYIITGALSAFYLNSSANIVENYNLGFNCTWWANDALTLADYRIATGDGANSLEADPRFVDLPRLDVRLWSDSPAIDAGVVVTPVTDGFVGSAPDIGVYEGVGVGVRLDWHAHLVVITRRWWSPAGVIITPPVVAQSEQLVTLDKWGPRHPDHLARITRPLTAGAAPLFVPDTTQPVTALSWAPVYPSRIPPRPRTTVFPQAVAPLFVPDTTQPVPSRAWAPHYPDRAPGKRRAADFPQAVAPLYVPDTTVIAPLRAWTPSYPDRIPARPRAPEFRGAVGPLYVPDVTNPVTPLSWTTQVPGPVRRRIAPATGLTEPPFTQVAPETVTIDKWQVPFVRVVRRNPALPASGVVQPVVTTAPEIVTVDKWVTGPAIIVRRSLIIPPSVTVAPIDPIAPVVVVMPYAGMATTLPPRQFARQLPRQQPDSGVPAPAIFTPVVPPTTPDDAITLVGNYSPSITLVGSYHPSLTMFGVYSPNVTLTANYHPSFQLLGMYNSTIYIYGRR